MVKWTPGKNLRSVNPPNFVSVGETFTVLHYIHSKEVLLDQGGGQVFNILNFSCVQKSIYCFTRNNSFDHSTKGE